MKGNEEWRITSVVIIRWWPQQRRKKGKEMLLVSTTSVDSMGTCKCSVATENSEQLATFNTRHTHTYTHTHTHTHIHTYTHTHNSCWLLYFTFTWEKFTRCTTSLYSWFKLSTPWLVRSVKFTLFLPLKLTLFALEMRVKNIRRVCAQMLKEGGRGRKKERKERKKVRNERYAKFSMRTSHWGNLRPVKWPNKLIHLTRT